MKVNTKQSQRNANANANFRALSIEDCIEMMKNRSSLPDIDL